MDIRLLTSELPLGALDKMAESALELISKIANSRGLAGKTDLIRKAGYSDNQIWEATLQAHLKPGMTVDIDEPKSLDSPHECMFTGTVEAVFEGYARVEDMEECFFDIEFDEILRFTN